MDHARSVEEVARITAIVHDGWIDLSTARRNHRKSLWQIALEPFEPDAQSGMREPTVFTHILEVRNAIAWRHWGSAVVDSVNEIDVSARFLTIDCHRDLLLRVEIEGLDIELRRAPIPPARPH